MAMPAKAAVDDVTQYDQAKDSKGGLINAKFVKKCLDALAERDGQETPLKMVISGWGWWQDRKDASKPRELILSFHGTEKQWIVKGATKQGIIDLMETKSANEWVGMKIQLVLVDTSMGPGVRVSGRFKERASPPNPPEWSPSAEQSNSNEDFPF